MARVAVAVAGGGGGGGTSASSITMTVIFGEARVARSAPQLHDLCVRTVRCPPRFGTDARHRSAWGGSTLVLAL